MKKFLCYDTNDASSGKINVDNRGMLKPNSTVPSGSAPYQQLVTDGNGNTRWEDRLAYVKQAFQKITYDSYEEITFNNNSEGMYEGQFPVNISKSGCPDGTKLKVSLDGTEYITNVSVIKESGYTAHVAGNLHFINQDAPDTGEPFYAVMMLADEVTAPGQSICQFFTTLSGDKHTVKIFLAEEIVHPVDDKFLPDMGGGLLIIDVDMSSMTTSLSTDEVILAMSEGKYPVLKVPYNKNDVMYLPFVCESSNGYSFCGYVYANAEWNLIGAVVSGNKLIKTVTSQFSGVDIMRSANALRIKSTDGQKTFAIVVDGDGTIRAEEVN